MNPARAGRYRHSDVGAAGLAISRALEHYSMPADAAVAVTVSERELMKKALGLDKGYKVTRNRYFATPGSSALRTFEALAERGLAVVAKHDAGDRVVCQVTKLGFAAMAKAPKKKAAEG